MNTSYYFSRLIKPNMNLVSISVSVPTMKGYSKLKFYKPLFPNWKIVYQYKKGSISKEEYTVIYNKQLNCLNPEDTIKALGKNAILLCWEKPGLFCHRHLVAEWLKKTTDTIVEELKEERQKSLWDKT